MILYERTNIFNYRIKHKKSVSFFLWICYYSVMKKNSFKSFLLMLSLAAFFSLFISACSSVPKDIPEDLTAQELIQKGQHEYELTRYKASLAYYNAVRERYADVPACYVEASYEIGHLFMKQKKYEKAKPHFEEILSFYENAQPGVLPGAYLKLTQIEMAKIPQ